jgi:cytochrome b561
MLNCASESRKGEDTVAVPVSYNRTQVLLHWIIAALVAFQIVFHDGIEELWNARMTGAIPNVPTPTPHTIVGLLILILMIWRVVVRLRNGAPPPPADEHPALRFLAGATHALFYVLLLAMPVSGAVAWFGGLELPAEAHELAAKLLIALVLLHLVAALVHRFWFRSGVVERIVRWS